MNKIDRLRNLLNRDKKPRESDPYRIQGMEIYERFRACNPNCPVIVAQKAISGASVRTKWRDFPEMQDDAARYNFIQQKNDCLSPIYSGRNANLIGKLEVGLCFLRFEKEIRTGIIS